MGWAQHDLGWWFQKFVISSLFGEIIPFDEHIFQLGGKPPTKVMGLKATPRKGQNTKQPENPPRNEKENDRKTHSATYDFRFKMLVFGLAYITRHRF